MYIVDVNKISLLRYFILGFEEDLKSNVAVKDALLEAQLLNDVEDVKLKCQSAVLHNKAI